MTEWLQPPVRRGWRLARRGHDEARAVRVDVYDFPGAKPSYWVPTTPPPTTDLSASASTFLAWSCRLADRPYLNVKKLVGKRAS